MLFKALNPEMFLEVVIFFFLAKFFKELHSMLSIVCLHICTKERANITLSIHTFFNVL